MKKYLSVLVVFFISIASYGQVNCSGVAPSTVNLTDKIGICNGNLQRTATVGQIIDTTKVGRIEQGRGSSPIFMYFNGTAWVRNDTSYAPKSLLIGYIPNNGTDLMNGEFRTPYIGSYRGVLKMNYANSYLRQEHSGGYGSYDLSSTQLGMNIIDGSVTANSRNFLVSRGDIYTLNNDIVKYTGLTHYQIATKLNSEPFGLVTKQYIDSIVVGSSLTSVYSSNSDIVVDSSITGKRRLTLNNSLTSGYIKIGDATNTAFPRALSGDVTVDNLGATTVNTINSITKSYYDPTSSIQTQLNAKQDKLSNYYVVSTISALQTYISGLGSGVDVNIWFPYGTYSVTTPITISNKGTVNIKSEGATLTNALTATGSVFAITTVTSCNVDNININMNLNTFTTNGISVDGVTQTSSFSNINMYSFYAITNIGLYLTNVTPNAPSNPSPNITNCNFYNIPAVGTFDYNSNTSKGIGISMPSGCEYWRISNCVFNALHMGIRLGNGANGLITNCDFTNNNPYLSGSKYGCIYIDDNASNIGKLTVSNCKFNHNWGYCFFSNTATLQYPPVTITGCVFISNAISALRMGAAATGAIVTGCDFRTANLQGSALNSPYTDADCDYILLQSNKNIIQSNYFWKQSTYHYAVKSIGTADSNVVKNNYIDPTMGTVTMVGSSNIVQLNGRQGDFIKQGSNIQARFTNSITGIGGLFAGGTDTTLQVIMGNVDHNGSNYIAKAKNTAAIAYSYGSNVPVITTYLNTGQTTGSTATLTTQSRQWLGGNLAIGSGVNIPTGSQTNTFHLLTGTSPSTGVASHSLINSSTITGSDDCPHIWTADSRNLYLGKRFGMRSNNDLNLATNNTVRMSIDSSSGNVGIGVTNAQSLLHVSTSGQNLSSVFNTSSLVLPINFTANKILSTRFIVSNDTSSRRALNYLVRTRGTNASPTTVASGDFLGGYRIGGYDGTNLIDGSNIETIVESTVSTGVMPTYMIFSTTATNTLVERMRITSAGNVGIGATAPNTKLEVNGAVSLTPTTSSTISGNYNGFDFGVANTIIRMDVTGTSGLQGIIAKHSGMIYKFVNVGSQSVTFEHEDATAIAANRILTSTSADVVVGVNDSITLFYDTTSSRWRQLK